MGIQRLQAQCGVCPLKAHRAVLTLEIPFTGVTHTTQSHSTALGEIHWTETLPRHHLQKCRELWENTELIEQQQYKACPHPLQPIPMGSFSVQPRYSTEDREAPAGAAFQVSSLQFYTHIHAMAPPEAVFAQPSVFPLAYRVAAWDVVSHRNNGIKGAWQYVQLTYTGIQILMNIVTVQSPQ